jgi:transposase
VKACSVNNKYLPTIKRIPDELWDEFKKILPREKPPKTVGRPIIPYRKVFDGILYVLRTGCQWKMLPKEYGSDYMKIFNSAEANHNWARFKVNILRMRVRL